MSLAERHETIEEDSQVLTSGSTEGQVSKNAGIHLKREMFGCVHSLSPCLITSLALPDFSSRGSLAVLLQSLPPRPGPSPWLLVNYLVILAFIGLAFIAYRRHQRRRARALTAIGAELGLRLQPRGVVGPQRARLPLFKFHRKAHAENILSGTVNGGEVLIFDYFCPTFAEEPSEPILQTVAAFRFPNAELPLFHLQTRTFLDKVPEWVRRLLGARYKDVILHSNPEFSRRFLLQAKDVNAVRSLFTPEGASFLETLAETDWFVEASGEWLLVYRRLVLLEPKPELYREFVTKASGIASAIAQPKVMGRSP